MLIKDKILIAKSKDDNKELAITLNKANRHGLITGASGSGKTITLKVMAESFSKAGVPVFYADIKSDLAGTALPGEENEKIKERLNFLKIEDFKFSGYPVTYWDVYAKNGHPIRTTISEVGPIILSSMLGLNDTQQGVLTIAYKFAKDNDYLLDDLKDLRLLLQFIADNRKELNIAYGNIAPQTIGTIQRNILMLEEQGGEYFFGEPALELDDLFKIDSDGRAYINNFHCADLFQKPKLYSSFMLWLLKTISTKLPEVGDLDKPKMVFFFDEAHTLFSDMPNYMKDEISSTVKLIRSKGIGLYFISQSPGDIPDEILGQLANKIQHTLRAYTPNDEKALKTAANAFRINPKFDTLEAIKNLGTGEAVISFLNEKGEPDVAEVATVLPPESLIGSIDDSTRTMIMSKSDFRGKYENKIERESAYEKISEWYKEKEELLKAIEEEKEAEKLAKEEAKLAKEKEREDAKKNQFAKSIAKSATRTAVHSIERRIISSIWKGLFKK